MYRYKLNYAILTSQHRIYNNGSLKVRSMLVVFLILTFTQNKNI